MRGRIRSIKPEVHLDDELWDLEERTSLPIFRAFTGLWNHADREGRFEWRARVLKAVILPYWVGDFEDVLAALAGDDFVTRYEVDGRVYGHVRTFQKHQSVNNKEEQSRLPAPPVTREARVRHASPQVSATREPPVQVAPGGKGREGKGREGNGAPHPRACDAHVANPVPETEPEPENPQLELEPDEPEPETQTPELVRRRFTVWFAKHRAGTPPTWGEKNAMHLRTLSDWLDALDGDAPLLLERTLKGFFADPKARSKGYPIAYLAQNPAEYLHPPEPERDVRNMGFVPAAPSGSYGKPTSVEELWGPKKASEGGE